MARKARVKPKAHRKAQPKAQPPVSRAAEQKAQKSTTINVAIYARVSTQDQDASMQVTDLRAYAKRMGWNAVVFIETASGKAGVARPQLEALMEDARLRKFDAVLVWKLDRFGRSLKEFVARVQLLDSYGIRFIALTQNIDTDRANPAGRLLMHILAAIAEFERDLIQERINAGIQEAMRRGVKFGRPRKIFSRVRAANMRKRGISWRKIGRVLGIPQSTIRQALKTYKVND